LSLESFSSTNMLPTQSQLASMMRINAFIFAATFGAQLRANPAK
jgi:hypothetical protein